MPAVPCVDELITTPAEQQALERLRSATGVSDGPMERHCVRVRHIAAHVAARRQWIVDGEILTVAALLHDIGLYPGFATDRPYTADGAEEAARLLPPLGWQPARVRLVGETIDRHHELRRQLSRGPEVEALRLADLIDLSAGLVRGGTDRDWMARLSAAVPRRGLYGELARVLRRALRERPATLPRIFLRSG